MTFQKFTGKIAYKLNHTIIQTGQVDHGRPDIWTSAAEHSVFSFALQPTFPLKLSFSQQQMAQVI